MNMLFYLFILILNLLSKQVAFKQFFVLANVAISHFVISSEQAVRIFYREYEYSLDVEKDPIVKCTHNSRTEILFCCETKCSFHIIVETAKLKQKLKSFEYTKFFVKRKFLKIVFFVFSLKVF
jgi:hypothetical protein